MEHKRAIVTGGSQGIGAAIAETLVKSGYRVLITGRDSQRLDRRREELSQFGTVYTASGDLAEPDTPRRIIAEAQSVLGGLDLLVNNAGSSFSAPFEEGTIDDWDRIMTVNARAPYFVCREALPILKTSPSPVIIQIGSVVGIKGYVNQSIYSASKHALAGFTKALAREVQSDGIRVHMIMPGGVATEMIKSMRPDINTSEMIQPQEIADWVLFLASRRGNAVVDELQIRRATKTPWE